MIDTDEFTCCAPSFISTINPKTALHVGARNLAVAEKINATIITPCSGCFKSLKEVQDELSKDPSKVNMINDFLSKTGKRYEGKVKVKHVMEVIMDDIGIETIKKRAKHSLRGLKIAPYYGCHLIRPSNISQFDDPEIPRSLDSIIEKFEGTSLDYEGKLDCCGGPLKTINDEISLELLDIKLKSLKKKSVDAVILACPFCFFQFEFGQKEILKERGVKYDIPILTVTEMLGLLLGLEPKELGFGLHIVKTKSFLSKFQEMNGKEGEGK